MILKIFENSQEEDNMRGPFKLDKNNIYKVDKSAGNYRLYRIDKNGRRHIYVGRSDTDLQRRLLEHFYYDNPVYDEFKFEYADDVEDAYNHECEDYHSFKNLQLILDNEIHPDKPDYMEYLPCPVSGCDK